MPGHRASKLECVCQHLRTPLLTDAIGAALAVAVVVGIDRGQQGAQRRASKGTEAVRQAQALADLRSSAIAAASTSAVATTVTRPHGAITVYLASMPDQVRTPRAWLAQGSTGMPGGAAQNAAVILAPSAAEAAFARAVMLD